MAKSVTMSVEEIVKKFGENKAADLISRRAAQLLALRHLEEWEEITDQLSKTPDALITLVVD